MTFSKSYQSFSLLIFLFSGITTLSGQSDTSNAKRNSLFATAGYGSNMIFLGSTISSNNPFYSTGLVYSLKNSFYISSAVTHIQGTSPFVAFYSAAVDYKHTFNSWFDISAEISGFKPASSLEETLFSNFIFTNFTSGFDWKILYTRLSGGLLFSDRTTGYVQLSNSRYFQTPYFLNNKAFISFYPDINLLMGEIAEIKTTSGVTSTSYKPPFRKFKHDQPSPTVSYSSRFGPLEIQFSIPVTFSYGRFSFETEPSYIVPAFKSTVMQIPKGFTFFLTAVFNIF